MMVKRCAGVGYSVELRLNNGIYELWNIRSQNQVLNDISFATESKEVAEIMFENECKYQRSL